MDFDAVITAIAGALETHGRLSYRMLKRRYGLDDEELEDLRSELIDARQVALDEGGRVLVWRNSVGEAPRVAAPATGDGLRRSPLSYTPKHLAERILNTRAALEGERKEVTVLFADVKGSMDLAAQLGPEAWHEVLDGMFEILTAGVHRYEGTVNQYTGDGIMALFGAPLAHEDHAQRACHAALYLRDGLREYGDRLRREGEVELGVRLGLNTGEVVVGRIGDDLRMDYTAQGHTVGLAQRIEQMAAPGQVLVSEHTARRVAGYFELGALVASAVPGTDVPVAAAELLVETGSRTRLEVAQARGLSRFVGRVAERAVLDAALARARDGHGQVVGVVGEPGLGKSRLCLEFVTRCRAQGLAVYEAHCPAHGRNIPFLPILELFRGYFGVRADDDARSAREKIATTLHALDSSLVDTLPVVFDFMGVSESATLVLEADARQSQLVALLHRIYRVHAERAEVSVVLIDDLHWVDPASDLLIAQLVAATAGSRNLLLVNFRPEYSAGWTEASHYQRLPLVPLRTSELRELAGSLLGDDASIAPLAARIETWTAGNPFYTEEVIASLAENGDLVGAPGRFRLARPLGTLRAPANVKAVLAARIDRLPEDAKRIVQTAAVIGRDFDAALLAAVEGGDPSARESALVRLRHGDLVFERALYPTLQYSFKHPLTHEVAYGTLLEQRRRSLHAAVAQAIEVLDAQRLDERAALIAHHHERAEQFEAAGSWHQRAALWALRGDTESAARHWRRAHDALSKTPQSAARDAALVQACAALLQMAIRAGGEEIDTQRYFDDGRKLAEAQGDRVSLALLLGSFGLHRGVALGEANDYFEYGAESARLARTCADDSVIFTCGLFHQFGAYYAGRFAESIAVGRNIVALAQGRADIGGNVLQQNGLATALIGLAWSLPMQGDMAGAAKHIDLAERVIEQIQSIEMGALVAIASSRSAAWRGDGAAQMAAARSAVELSDQLGSLYLRVFCYPILGVALLDAQDPRRALAIFDDADRINRDRRVALCWTGTIGGGRASALLALGDREGSFEAAEACIEFCRPRGLLRDLAPWLGLVRAALALGLDTRARATMDELRTLIDFTGACYYEPFLHELRAEYAVRFNAPWTREDALASARLWFERFDMPAHVARLATIR